MHNDQRTNPEPLHNSMYFIQVFNPVGAKYTWSYCRLSGNADLSYDRKGLSLYFHILPSHERRVLC